jgi:ribosomal protein S18 acetylase RimI-like enzyme
MDEAPRISPSEPRISGAATAFNIPLIQQIALRLQEICARRGDPVKLALIWEDRSMAAELTAREAGASARAATWADADALAVTMARAFFDDPLLCYILDGEATRAAKMPRLFKLLFKLGLPYGACDVTGGYEAAALWRPPGHWSIPIRQYLVNGFEFLSLFGFGGAVRVMGVMDFIEKHHPHEPHWYLQAIGTDPAMQGKGFGGIVIRRQLANADTAGQSAYLESSKASNIPIYQSFGFEVTGEVTLPGGPTIWPMWRAPRAPG